MIADRLGTLLVPQEGWEGLPGWAREGALPAILSRALPSRRWFGAKSRTIRSLRPESIIPIDGKDRGSIFLCILRVEYAEGAGEWYFLPLSRAREGEVPEAGMIARFEPSSDGFDCLVDGFFIPETGQELLREILSSEPSRTGLVRVRTEALAHRHVVQDPAIVPAVFRGEQSNTSLLFGRSLMLKGFRRLEPGMNPDLEVGAFLARVGAEVPIPATFGALLGGTPTGEPLVLLLLQEFVQNQGDAWSWFLSRLALVLTEEKSGDSLDRMVDHLGIQTAKLHRALGSDASDPDFAPLPFGPLDLDHLAEEVEDRLDRFFRFLENDASNRRLPVGGDTLALLPGKEALRRYVKECRKKGPGGLRIRCHGDFHLGQVLVTPESDVVFLDFEGEPALPLAKRRLRNTPLMDVAGMLRSLHYLALSVLPERPEFREAGEAWYARQSSRYLKAYKTELSDTVGFLPHGDQAKGVLGLCLLRKALYEMEYELNNRPGWLWIPLSGIASLLRAPVWEP